MKRIFSFLIAVAMLLSMVSCNGGASPQPEGTSSVYSEHETTAPFGSNGETEESESSESTSISGEVFPAYEEQSVYLAPGASFEWRMSFSKMGDIQIENSALHIVTVQTYGFDNDHEALILLNVGESAGYAQITAQLGEEKRVLHLYVEEPALGEEHLKEYSESVVYLEEYEIFEWIIYFKNNDIPEITMETEGVVNVLKWEAKDGGISITMEAGADTAFTMVTAVLGDQTRVLHVNVTGSTDPGEGPDPGTNNMIMVMDNAADRILVAGERKSRILLIANLPSDGTLTVENSNGDVLAVDYADTSVLEEHGLVSTIELYVKPLSAGESTVTVSYPEQPDAKLSLTFQVENEHHVLIGDGTLCQSISVDKTKAEVYKDDTAVTYTVVTPTTVDTLEFIHLSDGYYETVYTFGELTQLNADWLVELDKLTVNESTLSDGLIYNSEKKTWYSASRREENGTFVWTVSWNLGNTAVYFIQINAIDSQNDKTQENYVKLDITYPEFDVSAGLGAVINRWVELNLTEPLIFTVDTETLTDYQRLLYSDVSTVSHLFADECEILMGNITPREELAQWGHMRVDNLTDQELYDIRFDHNVIYRNTFVSRLMQYAMVATLLGNYRGENQLLQLGGKRILSYGLETPVFVFHYEIYDETRALIAYENGYEIDAEKFPYAYDMLKKGTAVIEEIITEGMTDFEKERAVYTWMIENYYKGVRVPSDDDWYACVKSAYGILNQYEADCMGWSGAFYLLCNMAGVPCSTHSCATGAGGASDNYKEANHRINVVRLDGEYYFVEVFWFFQKLSPSEGDYRFMNMTTEMAAEHYIWHSSKYFGPPVFNDTTFLVDEHTGNLISE